MSDSTTLTILLGISLLANLLLTLESNKAKNSNQLEQSQISKKIDELVRQNEENMKLLREIQQLNDEYKLLIEEQKSQIQRLQQQHLN